MKPIFSRNEDYTKIAFLNWRIDKWSDILNMLNIADGFMRSAIELSKFALNNNDDKAADILIFPILTNANHGIELYLKALTWMLNKKMEEDMRIEGAHNIRQIYATVRSKIKKYGGEITIKHFDEETEGLNNYIEELFEKTQATARQDKMDFSRYPFDNKYENHFYVDQIGNVEIDLENFEERFSAIHQSLEQLSDFLYHIELNRDHYE
ncbi:hypothetical protein [Pedobacter frigoris]|uniref:HEPN domain-containing protein n=1 Tax=Pedobacter frigoris TaxID=2571272 RepID=A0A4U1CDM7_9SPHI|nr:hypothetical protein [Pedobacter frigoris]TKC04238.1 hypothetical protein FA047_16715 [Pedobacter frigoris]